MALANGTCFLNGKITYINDPQCLIRNPTDCIWLDILFFFEKEMLYEGSKFFYFSDLLLG